MGKILVADDDSNIAELLRLYLEKEGYTVAIASDGERAAPMRSWESSAGSIPKTIIPSACR